MAPGADEPLARGGGGEHRGTSSPSRAGEMLGGAVSAPETRLWSRRLVLARSLRALAFQQRAVEKWV